MDKQLHTTEYCGGDYLSVSLRAASNVGMYAMFMNTWSSRDCWYATWLLNAFPWSSKLDKWQDAWIKDRWTRALIYQRLIG